MGNQEHATVVLDCCQFEVKVTFDEAEAPFLAPGRLRKNVSCPACPKFVILTLTRGGEGGQRIDQEVIG